MLVKKEEHDLLVEQNIEKAVNLELERIKVTYHFNSWHEAYAVLLEELEETEESLKITKHEALQVRAVALKAVEQLKNAHTDGNQ